ncbi:MAG: zinc ribbon domain-containing protein [Thermoplasmata archaeon]|nr:zinc ribbon domain-containing protein [Thermoplasmata archaeon]
MLLRTLLTIVNLGILVAAILAWVFDPAVSGYLFYGLLFWFIASIFIGRLPEMNRRVLESRPSWAGSPPPAPGAPLPSAPAGTELGFCARCGANVASGTVVCPSCGRALPVF